MPWYLHFICNCDGRNVWPLLFQCDHYRRGIISGSSCKALCDQRTLTMQRCMSTSSTHQVKETHTNFWVTWVTPTAKPETLFFLHEKYPKESPQLLRSHTNMHLLLLHCCLPCRCIAGCGRRDLLSLSVTSRMQ